MATETAPTDRDRTEEATPSGVSRSEGWWYAWSVIGTGLVSLLAQPIVALDHDIFYHLSHGRSILGGHGIPDSSYFSFIAPARAWVDYYWLFQVLVSTLHGVAGFVGLIVLRSVLFTVCMAAIAGIIFSVRVPKAERGGASRDPVAVSAAWGGAVVALFAVALVGRFHLVRPHTMSYTLIAVALYIIVARPRWLLGLPLLAALWVNLHGIEFPVLIAITVSYLGAYFLRRLTGGPLPVPFDHGGQRALLALALASLAILATPHGLRLLRVPFIDTHFASTYIAELATVQWRDVLRYDLAPLALDAAAASNLLIALMVVAAIAGLWRRPFPWAPYGLVIAGAVLLARSDRFRPELVLLALPLLRETLPAQGVWPRPGLGLAGGRLARLAVLALALLPLLYMGQNIRRFAHQPWPFSPQGLPSGGAAFLLHAADQADPRPPARLFNHPNQGGYWQWALGGRYQIFSDMEVPFLFRDEDQYLATGAFQDPEMLRGLLEQYQPDFLAAPLEHAAFAGIVEAVAPRFEPVFFDDRVVLFADGVRWPALVARWRLDTASPLAITGEGLEAMTSASRRQLGLQLTRMLELAPGMDIPRRALALVQRYEGQTDAARATAEAAVAVAPWAWQPLSILGSIQLQMGAAEEAVRTLESALERPGGQAAADIHRALSQAYRSVGRASDAYRALEQAVGRFNRAAPAGDLAQLGAFAAAAGEVAEARLLFAMARRKTPANALGLRQHLDAALAGLQPPAN